MLALLFAGQINEDSIKTVKLLIDKGANVKIVNKSKETPLLLAMVGGTRTV